MNKLLTGILTLIMTGTQINPAFSKGEIKLEKYNWNNETRVKLEKILNENSQKNKKVIFDFDNTVISRDIGEATFAYLLKNNMIDKEKIRAFSPSFTFEGKEVSIDNTVDISDYYEKLCSVTEHQENDTAIAMTAYTWVVQIMEGLTPYDVMNATKQAFMNNISSSDRKKAKNTKIEITEGKTSYMVPFFHPETVDLIGNLLLNNYDVYFVSASNVWTIRYMVMFELTKLINEKFKSNVKISPEKILGVNPLIRDKRTGLLYKDTLFVREKTKQSLLYGSMNENELKNYELTNQINSPITGYEGKVTNIMKFIVNENEKPFLIAGDSPGDYDMLKFSQNRLWFARLEKPDYQKNLNALIKKHQYKNWFIQPVLYKSMPGLISNKKQLETLLSNEKSSLEKAEKSLKIFNDNNFLKIF